MRPSGILGIDDTYTAFCFDEACDYIIGELSKKDAIKPHWVDDEKPEQKEDLISFLKGFGG